MTDSLPPIRLVRQLDGVANTRFIEARDARAGRLHRISWGAYADSAAWDELKAWQRYRLRVLAVAGTRRARMVISHESAAVLHGLPLISVPANVHFTVSRLGERNSSRGVAKHLTQLHADDVVEVEGMLVTSIERTVIDIAATSELAASVAVADRVLLVDRWGRFPPLATRELLMGAFRRAHPLRAHARVLFSINFAEEQSESALESVSRVSVYVSGAPRPHLQVLHRDAEGEIGFTDFDWDEFDAVGEADGDSKYLDEKQRGARSADQVVLDEKLREDRIRALPKKFTRWRWSTGISPQLMSVKLRALGLPLGKRWRVDPRN